MSYKWYLHTIRVRYQETDQMGVVFHGNYVTWFEIGRTEWVRSIGHHYRDIEQKGLLFPVIDLAVKYVSPAKYDDIVLICTRLKEYSPLRMEFENQIRRIDDINMIQQESLTTDELPGELLVTGGTKHVWVNEKFQPVRLNKVMPQLFDAISNINC